MKRSPRKPARFQPPLRGRAATQPQTQPGPARPDVAAYRPPLRPPASSTKLESHASPKVVKPANNPIVQEPASTNVVTPEHGASTFLAQLSEFMKSPWLWVLIALIALLFLAGINRSILGF